MKIKRQFKFLCDLFFVMRPILLVPVWGFSIFGYYRAHNFNLQTIHQSWFSVQPETYWEILLFSLSVGVVYVLNQLADIEVDKKNGGFPLIASGVISIKCAWIFSIIIGIISIVVPLLLNKPYISLFSLATIAIGVLYSFKPFFFSGKPVLDFLSNATGYGIIAFAVGWCAAGQDFLSIVFLKASLPYFFLMASGSINSTFPDVDGDRKESKCTTAVFLGIQSAQILSTTLLLLAGVSALIWHDYLAACCAFIALPIYLVYLFYPTRFLMEATYKAGGALCVLGAFMVMPLFLIISLCLFYLTRIYFKSVHNVSYPSMVPTKNV